MGRIRAGAAWHAALLIPPALILSVLLCLETFVSPVYAPNRFFVGVSFGIAAGFFEDTGYAFPQITKPLQAAIALGLCWGTWHIPVIDYLRLSPGSVTAGQEAMWYAAYAAALWLLVCIVAAKYGSKLTARAPDKTKKSLRHSVDGRKRSKKRPNLLEGRAIARFWQACSKPRAA